MELTTSRFDDAVSPVVGVILMVAVTVILAAVIGTFVLDLGNNVQENPQAGVTFDQAFSQSVDTNDDGNEDTDLYDVDAQVISVENADEVTVSHDGSDTTYYPDTSTTGEATETATVTVSGDPATSAGDTITVENLKEGDEVTIIGVLDGKEAVLQSFTVEG